jgi:hypothetical protein
MNGIIKKIVFWLLFGVTLVGLVWFLFLGFGERGWLKIVLVLVAIYPVIGMGQGFLKHHVPYIRGEAERREDGVCISKKWVWYDDDILWMFMVVPCLILLPLACAGVAGGYLLTTYVFCWLFMRQVVEKDITENDLKGYALWALVLISILIASTFRFRFNPFRIVHELAQKLETVVNPAFYGWSALLFFSISFYAFLKSWLCRRVSSDGTYLYCRSLFGKLRRYRLYSGGIATEVKDVLEQVLNCVRIRVRLSDKQDEVKGGNKLKAAPTNQPVVLFAAYGRGARDFEDLILHETPDEKAQRLREEDDGALRPTDAENPGQEDYDADGDGVDDAVDADNPEDVNGDEEPSP